MYISHLLSSVPAGLSVYGHNFEPSTARVPRSGGLYISIRQIYAKETGKKSERRDPKLGISHPKPERECSRIHRLSLALPPSAPGLRQSALLVAPQAAVVPGLFLAVPSYVGHRDFILPNLSRNS